MNVRFEPRAEWFSPPAVPGKGKISALGVREESLR